ncbi:MAG: DAK2 domain-containing protein, partial [Clostridia bacterium]|nr:DAK2 domain-containing protein [Clostridia bacterium]
MFLAGAALLEKNKAYIDSLNVFPVPDGDTGTNMSMTMQSAAREIKACPEGACDDTDICAAHNAERKNTEKALCVYSSFFLFN